MQKLLIVCCADKSN